MAASRLAHVTGTWVAPLQRATDTASQAGTFICPEATAQTALDPLCLVDQTQVSLGYTVQHRVMKGRCNDMPNIERADRRDKKKASKEKDARMRGKRSVFEMGKAAAKRYREGKAKAEAKARKR